MNSLLDKLQPYPFARLRQAMQGIEPPAHLKPVMLQIGEPKHPTPAVITQALNNAAAGFAQYPLTAGLPELRQACARWLHRRYNGLTLDPESEILPVLGSREALFSFAQVILNPIAQERQIVACPNPFYQIYEGAAFLSGGEIHFANSTPPRCLPDWNSVPEHIWPHVRLLFACSPDNPSGSVMRLDDWRELFELQEKHGFVIAADECYSEIYFDQKPIGALQAAAELGRSNKGIVMFTSLSKRSNAPGLRSGFVAGDPDLLRPFLLYTTLGAGAWNTILAIIGWAIYRFTDLKTPEDVVTLATKYSHEIGYVLLTAAVLIVCFLVYKGWKKTPEAQEDENEAEEEENED